MKFAITILACFAAAALAAKDSAAKERVNGALYKDPMDMPEECPSDWGMILKTYIPKTKQASLTVPCALDDSECLSQWPGINLWINDNHKDLFETDKVFVFANTNDTMPRL